MSRSRPARPQQPLTSGAQWAHLGPAVSAQSSSEQLASSGWPDASRAADGSTSGPVEPWSDAGRQNVSPHSAEQPRTHDRSEPESPGLGSTAHAPEARSGGSRRAEEQGGRLGALGVLTRVLVALAVPLSLLVVSIRLVATPLFLWIEYHRPGFPEDPYGFQAEDRMILGSHGMDYVLNWAPGPFLGEVRTSSGRPWFTPEEVSHMTDVKWVLQIGLWAGAVVVLAALVLGLLRRRDRDGLLTSVAVGGWLTVIAAAALAVGAALGWQQFFAGFHSLFFSDGTWTFSNADTLIRLYPTQFWMDAAGTIAVITVCGSVLAAVLAQRARSGRPGRRRA
ncbi:hypothetical protein GCM10009594_04140 [Kocuria palustris]|uniref:lipoprotein intramolecular transacylase Lit n=1 Tax=Kocuria palustris TaxID=71999 RepID=UPI001957748D|nr:integral membrane protein (TIGR01906 family) [Kocuria palustris]